jgi:hypothetical protein
MKYIRYHEPDENGEDTVTTLTVKRAIELAQLRADVIGHVYKNDDEALWDFMTVHYAYEVENPLMVERRLLLEAYVEFLQALQRDNAEGEALGTVDRRVIHAVQMAAVYGVAAEAIDMSHVDVIKQIDGVIKEAKIL